MDWLDLLAVQGILRSLLQHHNSKASIHQCSARTWPREDEKCWLLPPPGGQSSDCSRGEKELCVLGCNRWTKFPSYWAGRGDEHGFWFKMFQQVLLNFSIFSWITVSALTLCPLGPFAEALKIFSSWLVCRLVFFFPHTVVLVVKFSPTCHFNLVSGIPRACWCQGTLIICEFRIKPPFPVCGYICGKGWCRESFPNTYQTQIIKGDSDTRATYPLPSLPSSLFPLTYSQWLIQPHQLIAILPYPVTQSKLVIPDTCSVLAIENNQV